MNIRILSHLFLLLVIYTWDVKAFLDSIKATIDEAKVYLNDILPLINGGLIAVKQFEEFVENTIDEECYFECPRGKELRGPKTGHHKTSNGCGSMSVFFDDSEDSWIHVEREFREAFQKKTIPDFGTLSRLFFLVLYFSRDFFQTNVGR